MLREIDFLLKICWLIQTPHLCGGQLFEKRTLTQKCLSRLFEGHLLRNHASRAEVQTETEAKFKRGYFQNAALPKDMLTSCSYFAPLRRVIGICQARSATHVIECCGQLQCMCRSCQEWYCIVCTKHRLQRTLIKEITVSAVFYVGASPSEMIEKLRTPKRFCYRRRRCFRNLNK